MLVPFILMGAYAYYELAQPLFPDHLYDEWCIRLRRVAYRLRHRHLHLITVDGNIAGVLLKEEDYPEITKGATRDWIRRHAYPAY